MSPEGKQALEKWHQEQRDKDVVFDFQKELVEYCESDVRLLKQGCLTFKRLFEAQAGFNPFDHITIASACNRDLRMNRMIPNSIASEPVRGWKNSINHSNVAIEWLTWCAQEQSSEHSTCQKCRRGSHPNRGVRGWLLPRHPDRVRISRLFHPWMSHLSSKPPRKTCASL